MLLSSEKNVDFFSKMLKMINVDEIIFQKESGEVPKGSGKRGLGLGDIFLLCGNELFCVNKVLLLVLPPRCVQPPERGGGGRPTGLKK